MTINHEKNRKGKCINQIKKKENLNLKKQKQKKNKKKKTGKPEVVLQNKCKQKDRKRLV